LTYETIKAFAGLDTAWGVKAMEQAKNADWKNGDGSISNARFTIFYGTPKN